MISQLLERGSVNCVFGEKLCEIFPIEEIVTFYRRPERLISIHYKNGISQAVYRKMHIQSSMVDSVFIIYWISILAKVILRDAGLEPG
jgi:hypothetical protein